MIPILNSMTLLGEVKSITPVIHVLTGLAGFSRTPSDIRVHAQPPSYAASTDEREMFRARGSIALCVSNS